jgi:GTP-binding protein EngB required for normal cell division
MSDDTSEETSDSFKAVCSSCYTTNRVARDRIYDDPECGSCGVALESIRVRCESCQKINDLSLAKLKQSEAAPQCGGCSEDLELPELSRDGEENQSMEDMSYSDIRDLIDEYEERFSGVGWVDSAALSKRLNEIRRQLERPVRLSFVGNFSVGKSTVINSILGEEVAPVNQTPTTAVICHFRYGDTKRVRFHYEDGTFEEEGFFAFKQFSDHSQIDEENDDEQIERIERIDHVEIFYPNEVLREITLVDTPGFGASTEEDEDITRSHLRGADAVCWIFDADEVGKGSEVERIQKLSDEFRSAFALINQCDKKPPHERPKLRRRAEDLVGEHFDDILLYSALDVFEAEKGTIELRPEDLEHLESNLDEEIRERVRDQAEELRIQRARQQMARLSEGLLKHRNVWADIIDNIVGFFDDFESEMDDLEARFKGKLSTKLERLSKKLQNASRSQSLRFKKAFDVEHNFTSTDVEVDREALGEFQDRTAEKVIDAFEDWLEDVREVRNSIVESLRRLQNERFGSADSQENESDENRTPSVEIMTINKKIEDFEQELWRVIHVYQRILDNKYCFIPRRQILSSIDTTSRIIHSLAELEDVADSYQSVNVSDINDELEWYISADSSLESIRQRLNSDENEENSFIDECFDEIHSLSQQFREEFAERKVTLDEHRELLEAHSSSN